MLIRFKTTNSVFEINTSTNKIRRVPENIQGSWKQYVRVSKPQIGAPMLIVWAVDEKGAPTKSTVTHPVISYQTF